MKALAFITTALILGLGSLYAQESVQPAVQQTQPAVQHPFIDTGFYPRWSLMTPQAAVEDVREAERRSAERYAAIRAVPEGAETYENVFEAFEYADIEYQNALAYWGNLAMVRQTEGTAEAQQAITFIMAAHNAALAADDGLRQVVLRAAAQPWVKDLSPARQLYIQEVVDLFADDSDYTPEQKEHLQEISAEHAGLQRLFNRNVINSPNSWYHEVESMDELEGMPPEWIARAQLQGSRNGHMIIHLGMAYDILRYCSNEATRKLCWEGLNTIGFCEGFDNTPVIDAIMPLRQEIAEAEGFANYADMVCSDRMVDSGEKALAFVDSLMSLLQPAYQRENQELLDYISLCKGEKQEAINPWDYDFYRNQLYTAHHDFDVTSVRPYFRSDNVLKSLFATASQLYDITITEEPTIYLNPGEPLPDGKVEVWHPSVRVFKVTDNKTGQHLGSFYLDPYPRYGKQWGAWTQAMRAGSPSKDGQPHEPHLVVISTNATPQAHTSYALMEPREVAELFHEFGHALHNLLSDTEIRRHTGTFVALDFAELPSQLMENWAWEPEVIATFAFHHETGEPMPAELIQKLVEYRRFMPATTAMEKLFTAKLDLEMHMHYAEKFEGKPLDDVCNELLAPWRIPMTVQPPSPMRSCIHCLSRNYAAGYFSYLWSEMLAADAFSRFQQEGIMNPETGASFRNCILRHGGDRPAAELYRDFMGRDPSPDALLKNLGVLP